MQETEKFIEAVRKYPCLWNVYIPTYKCRETKDSAWREVIKHTSICDIDAAKDKWKKLKDAFREAINKRKKDIKLGKAKKMGRPYKFHHVMQFLIPILENRLSYNGDKVEDMLSNDEEGNESHMSPNSEQDAMAYVQVESDNHEPTQTATDVHRRGYKRNHSSDILEYLMEDAQRREAPSDRHHYEFDALDRFFLSMSETTKKFPEHLQVQVKRMVFNAVIGAEEANVRNLYNLTNDSSVEDRDVKPVLIPND